MELVSGGRPLLRHWHAYPLIGQEWTPSGGSLTRLPSDWPGGDADDFARPLVDLVTQAKPSLAI